MYILYFDYCASYAMPCVIIFSMDLQERVFLCIYGMTVYDFVYIVSFLMFLPYDDEIKLYMYISTDWLFCVSTEGNLNRPRVG